jgi:HD-GYP domain-containing protein (c-di-GMP phosphodiesterase class II)
MIRRICITDLRLGMHVRLNPTMLDDAFPVSDFRICSYEQIRRIRRTGIREVRVVSEDAAPVIAGDARREISPGGVGLSWARRNVVPPVLLEAIHDHKLAPRPRVRILYQHSREMIRRLLEAPTGPNLQDTKRAIAQIANLIVADDAIASHLLRITSHDFHTYTHSVNVGFLGIALAKALYRRSDGHDMEELGAAFFLHDIGKVRVSSRLINKPERLSHEEILQMRAHPQEGHDLLRDAGVLSDECRVVILQHHERYDGTGYPLEVSGSDIHPYSRICCMADVFDALTSERSYKEPLPRFEALKLMRDEMANHFDQDMFRRFVLLFA